MSFRRILLAGVITLLASLPMSVFATSVEPPEFSSLVSQSDYVVRGVVTSITAEWREGPEGQRYIASKIAIEVREVLRGNPPSPLVLDVVGGKIGDTELVVTGSPKFGVGEESILFLKADNNLITPLVAIMHGLYPIVRDAKTGEAYAVRSNGMPIYSEQDVSLPMEKLSAVKTRNAAAKPLTAATFMSKIRAASVRTPVASTNAK